MILAFLVYLLLVGASAVGVILGARWLDALSWRRSLVTYCLRFPSTLTAADTARLLASISATTHSAQWSVLPLPPVCLEVVSTASGIAFYLLVSRQNAETILSGLRAVMPGVRIEAAPDRPAAAPLRVAFEARLTSRTRPLATDRAEAISTALMTALQPVSAQQEIRIQWIGTSAGTPSPVHTAAPGNDNWWSAYVLEGEPPRDAEAVRALRQKRQEPLLRMVLRIGAGAPTNAQAYRLLGRVWPALHLANAPGVRLVRRWLPPKLVARRLAVHAFPVANWPLLASTREAAGLVALPISGLPLPGLDVRTARQLPPSPHMPRRGAVVAVSNYAGAAGRPLALKAVDRLRHLWISGPTGGGKSTLLAQLALHDIRSGAGVVVIDPKDDLVDDILNRVPTERVRDVIAMDAGDPDRPVGLNVLHHTGSGHSRELAVDNVVHIFSELWRSSWGPRTSDVLRNSLLTLAHTTADGAPFTLCEVPDLLLNPSFRRFVTAQPTVPEAVQGFWVWYGSLTDGQRAAVIGPSLNKLRALTTRTAARLLLGQSVGIDLGAVFARRKILLVKLSKGTVGTETAHLLGALVVASLWQATLARLQLPRDRRHPVFAYLDEFGDIVKLPLPLPDLLSQARGLGLSVTLANQYARQLRKSVLAAVLGTVRTEIAFQLDHDDARLLEKRFAPLTIADLTGLEQYEVAMRPTVNGQVLAPVTGTTLPLAVATRDGGQLATESRKRYGMPRADVEAALRARTSVGAASASVHLGRRRGGQP